MRGQSWLNWSLGFVAGAAVASWLALSCSDAVAQSPEVGAAIHQAAMRHGVSERYLRAVAWCESRFLPWVTSRGGHMGLFQFAASTWRWMSAQAGWAGYSPYDPWAASEVAAWAFSRGYARHWSCALMPVPAAEHARVKRETKAERNARAWVRRRKGWVRATPYHGETLYIVRVPGFHPAAALRLEQAVAQLQHMVAHWTGEKGSTGARLREPDGD